MRTSITSYEVHHRIETKRKLLAFVLFLLFTKFTPSNIMNQL